MRVFTYIDICCMSGNCAKGCHVITDYEILLIYWCWWQKEVFARRPDNTFKIDIDECIDDWLTTHWAKEIYYE